MTLRVITTQEKLDAIERLLAAEFRHTGTKSEALAAVAADLRARLEGVPSVTMIEIERRVVLVKRSQGPTGYNKHAVHGLGEGVAARWPVIKQALELFGAAVENSQ